MTPVIIGKCLDVAVPLVVGVIGLFYYPRRIAKDVESGKISDAEGKKRLKIIRLTCCFGICLGLYNINEFFR